MKRLFSKRQRLILAFIAGGRCQSCGVRLNKSFHADHVHPFSAGGATVVLNGQALCSHCNTSKGKTMLSLRPWQQSALDKALVWLLQKRIDKHFLINAAPGAGKTIAACAIAKKLFELNEIDRVIVIAPRSEVVNQWATDFYATTGRYMGKVTAKDGDVSNLGIDLCATWAAIQGLSDAFQAVCNHSRVLIVCDEHHHAAVKAAWGTGADSAFSKAEFVIVLTGTPIRSDGEQSVWLAYDDNGAIDHPEDGTFTLTYGEAVDLAYCRPVTFHRHEGRFSVDLEDGELISVSSKEGAKLTSDLKRIPGLQRALNFYKLACTPQYAPDGETPLAEGYQGTMIEWGISKLADVRNRLPNAGGLVIAPSIEMAEYMAKLLKLLDGEDPIIVHSQTPNPDNKIGAFRKTEKKWLVSVAMVSEGVDIPRLRILVYLPNALTELAFRQAIGRVVRTSGPEDDTRAYVVMPSFDLLETYARKVEDEMSPSSRKDTGPAKQKKCPACGTENSLSAKTCSFCEHEFPEPTPKFKLCEACEAQNPIGATTCQSCGAKFTVDYTIRLDEALRAGAIVRGIDIDEEEVKESEELADSVRQKILDSGDAKLIKLIRSWPEESFARFKKILKDSE